MKTIAHPIGKWQAWFLATRPKTLTAAFVPVLAASVLGRGRWDIALFALLMAFAIQIGTNLINDALDFKKGADTKQRLGPLRATQSGLLSMQEVFTGAVIAFALAAVFGIPLILYGGWPIALLVFISIACGYLYTGGPMPLAYAGLGDLFVFIFFGLVSTMAVYYLQTGFLDIKAFLAGAQIGLLATSLIAINNLRDNKGDAKAKKCTLAVRFGEQFARIEITFLILFPFLLNAFWMQLDYQLAALLPLLTLPVASRLVRNIWVSEPSSSFNHFLGQAAFLHLTFGIFLTLGFWT